MDASVEPVNIERISTGVPNLDDVLGGGLPSLSLTIVAGPPGTGKTTITQQILFHTGTVERPSLYFSTLGEPIPKILRYQQQFGFFDRTRVDKQVRFFDLGEILQHRGLTGALDFIGEMVRVHSAKVVAIDSFRAIEELALNEPHFTLRRFVHNLAVQLSLWDTTALLLGEYGEQELRLGSEFTIADGVIFLSQEASDNAVVRRLQVIKMRGSNNQPGRHAFRIATEGVHVFPRLAPVEEPTDFELPRVRMTFGVPGLDAMLSGGIPTGEAVLIAGSSGTGKTLLSLHFVVEGAQHDEPAVLVTFEEHPAEHARKAAGFGWDLRALEQKGLLEMIYLRPTDLSVDEVLGRIHEAVLRIKARRLVVNSISGFEIALTPGSRDDLREGLYRLVSSMVTRHVTTVLTTEVPDLIGDLKISRDGISFLADNIILLRYVEIESAMQKAMMVVKMRTSDHAKELRRYQITNHGIQVEQPFTQYSGVLSGIPTLRAVVEPRPYTTGLAERDESLMQVLLALREATPEELATGLGDDVDIVQQRLERLSDTGYVLKASRGEQVVYRVALVSTGTKHRTRSSD